MVKHRRSSGSFWAKSVPSPTCGLTVGQFWESSVETRMGNRYRHGNVDLFIENKDYSQRCTWTISTWLEESRTWVLCEEIGETGWTSRTTSFHDHVYLECTQRECKPERNYDWEVQKMFGNWKIAWVEETSRKNCRVVLRHGRTREKVRRNCELVNKKTEQL